MSRRLVAAIVAALAVAGCADDREQSPMSPELVIGANCRYNDVKRYARDLFGSNTPGYDLAQQMSGFAANSDGATGLAFDIFAAIAAKRNAALADADDALVFTSTDISNAANLTVQTIACARVSLSGPGSATIFQQALATTGGYEVRGDATKDASLNSTPVKTGDGLSGVNTPVTDGSNELFSAWLTTRTLFYGRPISTFSSEFSNGRAYDWSIVQAGTSLTGVPRPGLVSLCIELPDDASDADLAQYRVEHRVNTLKTILPFTDESFLTCPAVLPTVVTRSAITDRLIRLIAPEPAYAFAVGKSGSPTGSAGSFSPFEAVNPVDVRISFTSDPKDSFKNQALLGTKGPVAVKVTGDKGTPWQAVTVVIYGVNNNGEKVLFSEATEETNEAGIATFDAISTNKTGAYKLVAKTQETSPGSVSFSQDSVISKRFNVRP